MDNEATNMTNVAGSTVNAETATSQGRALRPRKTTEAALTDTGAGKNKSKPARKGTRSARVVTTVTESTSTTSVIPAPILRGGRATAATQGRSSQHATVPQPIFTFVTAPKVTDTAHEALTRCLDLRLEYE